MESEEWESAGSEFNDESEYFTTLESEGVLPNETVEKTPEEKKKAKAEQKELQKSRKLTKPHGSLIQKAKKLWGPIAQKSTSADQRKQLMADMMTLVSGHIEDLIFKHDASRIIQTCLKYGSLEQRNSIADELKSHYVELAKSQYGKFIVSKIMNFWYLLASSHPSMAKSGNS
jgi:pumilio family protein 6